MGFEWCFIFSRLCCCCGCCRNSSSEHSQLNAGLDNSFESLSLRTSFASPLRAPFTPQAGVASPFSRNVSFGSSLASPSSESLSPIEDPEICSMLDKISRLDSSIFAPPFSERQASFIREFINPGNLLIKTIGVSDFQAAAHNSTLIEDSYNRVVDCIQGFLPNCAQYFIAILPDLVKRLKMQIVPVPALLNKDAAGNDVYSSEYGPEKFTNTLSVYSERFKLRVQLNPSNSAEVRPSDQQLLSAIIRLTIPKGWSRTIEISSVCVEVSQNTLPPT